MTENKDVQQVSNTFPKLPQLGILCSFRRGCGKVTTDPCGTVYERAHLMPPILQPLLSSLWVFFSYAVLGSHARI